MLFGGNFPTWLASSKYKPRGPNPQFGPFNFPANKKYLYDIVSILDSCFKEMLMEKYLLHIHFM